ncbi:WD40 repeat domain-containing protein Ecym_2491 [Eremothecium cymbalariae DBVPG|uniref:Guanine nucleotide-exchange factor SEC12 n=1 Tax=Eremothecium cymbalariae (strain CBS 270.75 / DBVPG 7215 / KCTC 17166 / NRRL Y-17582) TaxID=931890 RepID=G8JPV5_ERECY|nr:Hypothetical protein Ecym_2491 [Eremothecium cymbalariae DBVPG\
MKLQSTLYNVGYPVYGARFLNNTTLLVTGGGGEGNNGIPNKLTALQLNFQKKKIVKRFRELTLNENDDSPTTLDVAQDIILMGCNENSQKIKSGLPNHHLRKFVYENEHLRFVGAIDLNRSDNPEDYTKLLYMSQDGTVAAIASSVVPTIIRIVNPTNLRETYEVETGNDVKDLHFSSDGKVLAYITSSTLEVISIVTGNFIVRKTDFDRNLNLSKIRFIGEDTILIAASLKKSSGVALIKISLKKGNTSILKTKIVTKKFKSVTSMDVDPKGQLAVLAGSDNSVAIIKLKSFSVGKFFKQVHTFAVTRVSFSPDSKLLISVSAANTIHIVQIPDDFATRTSVWEKLYKIIVNFLLVVILALLIQTSYKHDLHMKAYGSVRKLWNRDSNSGNAFFNDFFQPQKTLVGDVITSKTEPLNTEHSFVNTNDWLTEVRLSTLDIPLTTSQIYELEATATDILYSESQETFDIVSGVSHSGNINYVSSNIVASSKSNNYEEPVQFDSYGLESLSISKSEGTHVSTTESHVASSDTTTNLNEGAYVLTRAAQRLTLQLESSANKGSKDIHEIALESLSSKSIELASPIATKPSLLIESIRDRISSSDDSDSKEFTLTYSTHNDPQSVDKDIPTTATSNDQYLGIEANYSKINLAPENSIFTSSASESSGASMPVSGRLSLLAELESDLDIADQTTASFNLITNSTNIIPTGSSVNKLTTLTNKVPLATKRENFGGQIIIPSAVINVSGILDDYSVGFMDEISSNNNNNNPTFTQDNEVAEEEQENKDIEHGSKILADLASFKSSLTIVNSETTLNPEILSSTADKVDFETFILSSSKETSSHADASTPPKDKDYGSQDQMIDLEEKFLVITPVDESTEIKPISLPSSNGNSDFVKDFKETSSYEAIDSSEQTSRKGILHAVSEMANYVKGSSSNLETHKMVNTVTTTVTENSSLPSVELDSASSIEVITVKEIVKETVFVTERVVETSAAALEHDEL